MNKINLISDAFYKIYNGYINLCACCSYPFQSVLDVLSIPIHMTPTEGLPGKRYFPDLSYLNDIELLSEKILLNLFNATDLYGATIQPHSGTQANQIVFNTILSLNDIVLSLSPKEGGHISHTKLSGKGNKVIHYRLGSNNEIDYDYIEKLCFKYKPKLIIVGTSSYSKAIDFKKISTIAHKHNAYLLADISHWVLFILGKTVSSCIPYADFITFTLDKLLCGPQGGILLYKLSFKKDIDYAVFPVSQGAPLQNYLFAKYACLLELTKISLTDYAHVVNENAVLLAHTLRNNGLYIVTESINNHIILVNTSKNDLNGVMAENLLFKAKLLCNKNQIPDDKYDADNPSGIRLGTTCISNLNFSRKDIVLLGDIISEILINKTIVRIKEVEYLVEKYLVSPMR